VRGLWESVSLLKFRRGSWQWQGLKKFHREFGATTACTVRLCDALNLSELHEVPPLARCVFADSWFASVKTVMALRGELGLHFTGPVKTATSNYPIEANYASHFGENETGGTYCVEVS
jgi:hypothetical protein